MNNDEKYMRIALEEARIAFELGEIPVGAVIVNNETHEVIAKSHNLKETTKDVSAHAEMLAIKEANRKNSNWRLNNHTIYVTLEPCSMCASAILQSRLDRVVIGANEPLMGAFGSRIDLTREFSSNITLTTGVLKEECLAIIKEFFKTKR